MANKPSVKLYLVQDNWIELYQEAYTEKQKFKIGIALNKLPVVKYNKRKKCNIISLYYYEEAVKILEKKGIIVYVEERIPKAYKRLQRKINKKSFPVPSEQPQKWTKDKDKAILGYQQKATQAVLNRLKFIVADQMGCISGDATIKIKRNSSPRLITIRELYNKYNGIRGKWTDIKTLTNSMCSDGCLRLNEIKGVYHKGVKNVIKIFAETDNWERYNIELTKDHELYEKERGWIEAKELKEGDRIAVNGLKYCEICKEHTEHVEYKYAKFYGECKKCVYRLKRNNNDRKGTIENDGYKRIFGMFHHPNVTKLGYVYEHILVYEANMNNLSFDEFIKKIKYNNTDGLIFLSHNGYEIHHMDGNKLNNDIKNLEHITVSEHHKTHGKLGNIKHMKINYAEIHKIKDIGKTIDVYDITMKSPNNNFIANGVIVHNCGKTIEALATMCYAFEYGYNRALIVVMASLKEQWKQEILDFTDFTEDDIIILGDNKKVKCKTGAVEKFHGGKKVCKECLHFSNCQLMKQSPDKIRRHQLLKQRNVPIVITNYGMVYKYSDQLINGGFDIYIVDEASKIKNVRSQQTRGMMKLARKFDDYDIFMPMSGTLIENRIQEFYPVFSMIDEAIFGSWTNFKNRYLVLDFFGKAVDVQNQEELKKIVDKFMIRRTLDQVWKDRPPLYEMNRYCEMSPIHEKNYNEILDGKAKELRDEIDKKINKMEVASLLVHLTMVADTLESVKDLGKHSAGDYSCKIVMLKDMLENEIDGKVVIFSRYAKRVIPIIRRELKRIGVDNLLITGATKTEKRSSIVRKFGKKDKYKVLICSDAMGYGANIQCANYLINFDLPWNPAVIDQRIARLYRKGQKKSVTVINLITKNTVEDLILDKIYGKRKMFDEFMGAGLKPETILKKMTVNDILKKVENVG